MSIKAADAIYVDLDVLLDTRMGTLALFGQDIAINVLQSGYHQRDHDNFKGVDREAYRKAYKERDVETLGRSYPTNAFKMITHFLTLMNHQTSLRPDINEPGIEVNIWPYKLDVEDAAVFEQCIRSYFRETQRVIMINKAPKDISMADVKASYKFMMKYEFAEWLEAIAEELQTVTAPEVMLYSPAIYHVEVPTQKQLAEMRRAIPPMHPFEASQFEVRPFIGLSYLDAEHFSLLSPDQKP
jgi:hypothetical protein